MAFLFPSINTVLPVYDTCSRPHAFFRTACEGVRGPIIDACSMLIAAQTALRCAVADRAPRVTSPLAVYSEDHSSCQVKGLGNSLVAYDHGNIR